MDWKLFLAVVLLCGLSCKPEPKPLTWQTDQQGVRYWIVGDSLGVDTLQLGQKIKLQLEIVKGDSSIYNSTKRGEALDLQHDPKLFSGTFQTALSKMTVGDSALLHMKSTQFYPGGMPAGLTVGDSIQCRIKLIDIIK